MRFSADFLSRLFRRNTSQRRYLPEVDGLRFIAISLVFLLHMLFVYGQWYGPEPVSFPLKLGAFFGGGYKGVYLFFTISGFIVALPFARHFQNGEPIGSLRNYYLRRLVRIEPPYVIFMTFLLALRLLSAEESAGYLLKHWAASIFYLHNILYDRPSIFTVIAWSLEVEIQFYLLAPLLFWVFRLSSKAQAVVFPVVFGAAVALSEAVPAQPVTLAQFFPYFWGGLGVASVYARTQRIYKGFGWLLPFAVVLFLFVALVPQWGWAVRLALPLLATLLLFMGLFAGPVKQFLSLKVLTLIGGMCYSIYLTHFFVIGHLGEYPFPERFHFSYPPLDYLWHCLLYAVPVLLVAAGFYLLVEKPFMNAGKRLARKD